jgi:hypothetical protein
VIFPHLTSCELYTVHCAGTWTGVQAGRPPTEGKAGVPFNPGHLDLSLFLLPTRAYLRTPPYLISTDVLAGSCVRVDGQLQRFVATEQEAAQAGAGCYVFDLAPALRTKVRRDGWSKLVIDLRLGTAVLEAKSAARPTRIGQSVAVQAMDEASLVPTSACSAGRPCCWTCVASFQCCPLHARLCPSLDAHLVVCFLFASSFGCCLHALLSALSLHPRGTAIKPLFHARSLPATLLQDHRAARENMSGRICRHPQPHCR